MLKNLTVSAKTGLGFSLILLFMATMFVFAVRGLQSTSDSFTTYRRLARSNTQRGTSRTMPYGGCQHLATASRQHARHQQRRPADRPTHPPAARPHMAPCGGGLSIS